MLSMIGGDEWPMDEVSSPMAGWKYEDVCGTSSGPALIDYYGKLYHHILSNLRAFETRLTNCGAELHLYNLDATQLPSMLKPASFA